MAAGLLVVPGITGAALLWAQQSGQIHLEGPYRLIPIGLVLLAITVQIIAVDAGGAEVAGRLGVPASFDPRHGPPQRCGGLFAAA